MTDDRGAAESRAMEQLAFRLREAFASRVSDREIDERVREAYHRFDGSKVREFVPLLVENAVRRDLLAEQRAAADSGSGVVGGAVSGGAVAGGAGSNGAVAADAAQPERLVA